MIRSGFVCRTSLTLISMMICSQSSQWPFRNFWTKRAVRKAVVHRYMPDFKTFANTLGLSFNNISLLAEALTHRSYLNEHREYLGSHNERLEFLGDAVLELATTDFLYKKSVVASSSTASPKNSSRSLWLPKYSRCSLRYERCVKASARRLMLLNESPSVFANVLKSGMYRCTTVFLTARFVQKFLNGHCDDWEHIIIEIKVNDVLQTEPLRIVQTPLPGF